MVPRVCCLLTGVLLAVAACSSDSKSPGATGIGSASGQARGTVTVFAAASLTEAFTAAGTALHVEQPGVTVTFSFGASGTLVTQIQQGAPADLVATADTATMQQLVDGGLVDPPVTFAHNRLEIIVAPGNPKHIATLADLARSDLTLVLADPSVPAGKYAAQVLAGADVEVTPTSLETDVKAAVARVTNGEADAAIVYATDVHAAGSKASGVEIPANQNVVADYPIAIVKATHNRAVAEAFIEAITHGSGHDALAQAGFAT